MKVLRSKLFKTLSAVLAVVIVFATCYLFYINKQAKTSYVQGNVDEVAMLEDGEGNVLTEDNVYDMPERIIYSGQLLGNTSTNPTSVTLSATVLPTDAANKNLTWAVAWVDGTTGWAKSKTVTEYVTVTANTSDSTKATVTFLKPFGAQIKITATSRQNSNAKAECLCDYAKRIQSLQTFVGESSSTGASFLNTVNPSSNVTLQCTPTFGDYTVEDTFTYSAKISFNSTFINALTTNGLTPEVTANQAVSITYSGAFGINACPSQKDNILNNFVTRNKYMRALAAVGEQHSIGTITVTATGTYSTYTGEYSVIISPGTISYSVESVTVSPTSIIF